MTISLLELIRKEYNRQGKPLKIVADWDEVLQPLKMMLLYQLSSKELSLPEYFKRFWERAAIHYTKSHGRGGQFVVDEEEAKKIFGQSHTYSYIDPYDKNEKKNMPRLNAYRDKVDIEFYHDPLRYEKTPWTSIAGELLQCLKEDLISELVITTSYLKKNNPTGKREKKDNKFDKTFGLFPQCKFDKMAVAPKKEGEVPTPHRWDWIKANHSDFDIFIDDNPIYVERTWELFPEKVHVLPEYYTNKYLQKPNIYHVKTFLYELADLKDEDFAKAAEEYKAKKEQELATKSTSAVSSAERERERESKELRERIAELKAITNRTTEQEAELKSKKQELVDLEKQQSQEPKKTNWIPWLIGGGIALVIIIGVIIYFLTRKKEPSKDYDEWK